MNQDDFTACIQRFVKRHHYNDFKPRAALVDMDGTLYDSMPRHADAWTQMCAEAGLQCDHDEFFLHEGMTGAQTIGLLIERNWGRKATPEECEHLYHRKTELFRTGPSVDVMPGAQTLISTMLAVGLRTVLVTGSGQNSLLNRIESDYPGAFPADRRVTSRDVKNGKPHPEPYIRAMQLAGVSPSASISIENAPLGVTSADAAGAFTVGVVTGPVPREELERAGAAIVFDSMPQCADLFPYLLYTMVTFINQEI